MMGAMAAALQSLAVAASLLGLDPRPAAPPPAPKPILRLPLAEIVQNQERAWVYEQAGRGRVGFCAALEPKAHLWIKLRQDDQALARPLSDFEAGVEADFPVERYRVVLENGMLRAFPAEPPQSPQALVSTPSLLRGLVDLAEHVLLSPFEYAVVYEDGSLVPASVTLISEDRAGRLRASYHAAADLAKVVWFASAGEVRYGMRLDGADLVFYSDGAGQARLKR